MNFTTLIILPAIAVLSLSSCVVPGGYPEPGVSAVGVSYGTYDTLPSHYVGDAYYYGGRYYAGGRYESGRFYDHGHAYSDRYYHNGRYYYGGRHEHHGDRGNQHRDGNRQDPRVQYSDRESSRQPDRYTQPYTIRRTQ